MRPKNESLATCSAAGTAGAAPWRVAGTWDGDPACSLPAVLAPSTAAVATKGEQA